MSRLSKSGIEDALGIPSIEELSDAMKKLEQPQLEEKEINSKNLDLPYDAPNTEDIKAAYEAIKSFKPDLTENANVVMGTLAEDLSRLDKISDLCLKYFEDVMDKGFNAEDKNGHFYFGAAAGLMREAVNSHNAKALAKIKFAEFELKRIKMEQDRLNDAGGNRVINDNGSTYIDRNSLLKKGPK